MIDKKYAPSTVLQSSLSSKQNETYKQFLNSTPAEQTEMAKNNPWLTKVITPDEQKFLKVYGPALQKLNNTVNPLIRALPTRILALRTILSLLPPMIIMLKVKAIQKSPAETQAQWTTIAGLPPGAQSAYQTFQKSLPDHSPAYDLTGTGTAIDKNGNQSSASKFQIYANYKKTYPGSAERSQLEAMNPWLTTTFQAEQAQFNSSKYKSTSVPYNPPLPRGRYIKRPYLSGYKPFS